MATTNKRRHLAWVLTAGVFLGAGSNASADDGNSVLDLMRYFNERRQTEAIEEQNARARDEDLDDLIRSGRPKVCTYELHAGRLIERCRR